MKVRVKDTGAVGFYGEQRRRAGEVFNIADEPKNPTTGMPMAFSSVWMEALDDESQAPSRAAQQDAAPAPRTRARAGGPKTDRPSDDNVI